MLDYTGANTHVAGQTYTISSMAQSSAFQNHNKVCVVRSMWLRAVPRWRGKHAEPTPEGQRRAHAPVSNESVGYDKASRSDPPQRAAEEKTKRG